MARLRRCIASTAAVLAVAGLVASPAMAAGQSPSQQSSGGHGPDGRAPVVFGAAAWGTTVRAAGGIVTSGRTALASLGCTNRTGLERVNNVAGVSLGDLGSVGAVTSTASTSRVGDRYVARSVSQVAGATLLGGQVELTGITTVATASKDAAGYHAHATTTIAHLVVGGVEVELTGGEQVIDIPGVAKLTIAHSNALRRADHSSASGTGVTLELVGGGAVVKIGNAEASADGRQTDAIFTGNAYTSQVVVGGVVTAGRTAVKKLPCIGTFGQDRSNSTLASDLGSLGTIGVTKSTVNATATPQPDATVTAEVADVSLKVVGLATINIVGIKAQAHVQEALDGTVTTDLGGSTVGSIKVKPLGLPAITIPIPSQPNTSIELPLGLGSIDFMSTRDLRGGRGLEVVALQVHLALTDTHVTLASASATIR
jgi:hypothetical protein